MKIFLLTILVGIIMTGCGEKVVNEIFCSDIKDPSTCVSAEEKIDDIDKIHRASLKALTALKERDIATIKEIMSKDGIRFSPYSYVDKSDDIVMTKDDIEEIVGENKKLTRGSADGTGYPIYTTFSDYWTRYVYNAKFLSEGIPYINTRVQRGNMTNNVYDIYNGDTIIEYYIPGQSDIYKKMDRKSLTLVFSKEENEFKLKAIIHGERTI